MLAAKDPWKVQQELASNNSRLFKESVILREANAKNHDFFKGCRLAFDSMVTFGIKKVPEKSGSGLGLNFRDFWKTAELLADRQLTGDAAQDAVRAIMDQATQEQWNSWYRLILIKDLRAGFSETTINHVVGESHQYSVPVFTCQLAHDGTRNEKHLHGLKQIQIKLDGVRMLTVVYPDGRVNQYSRSGKELVNFGHISAQIRDVADQFDEPMVLDGEIMSSSFQDLMKQAHRKTDVDANDAVLNLFDIISLSEFQSGRGSQSQADRSARLSAWYHGCLVADPGALSNVRVVDHEVVDLDSATGQTRLQQLNREALDQGYEGLMLKDLDAVYECKRSRAWLKIKPWIEVTLTAMAVEEGTGKYRGKMGAVLFEGHDDGKDISVSVGSGWSDEDREDIWQAFQSGGVIGELGEVRADAATLSQDGTVWSLRFPRFKTWRGFNAGEKL